MVATLMDRPNAGGPMRGLGICVCFSGDEGERMDLRGYLALELSLFFISE